MNPMSIMAQAEKLGIPELQRSIQDGVVPAFIGVPLLQEKVKKAKQMQMGMAAQQPKRPSVAEQVGQEAQQVSVEDMMRERARMMQGEMGQTGGISDFLPKSESFSAGGAVARVLKSVGGAVDVMALPTLIDTLTAENPDDIATANKRRAEDKKSKDSDEPDGYVGADIKNHAKGGIIAFADRGLVPAPSYSKFGTGLTDTSLGFTNTPEYEDLVRRYGRSEVAKRIAQNLYQGTVGTYVQGAKDFGSRVKGYVESMRDVPEALADITGWYGTENDPRNSVRGIDVTDPQAQVVKPQVVALQNQPAVNVIDRRAPVAQPVTENILNKNAPNKQAPDVDQVQAMQNRIAARKAPPVMGDNAPAVTRTPYAQAAAPATQAPTTQAQPAQEEEKDLTLAERMKEYHDVTGENKGIAALQSRLAEREGRLAKEEERAPWMALMQAGLATMAGTSPNAMTNIGQGGVAGLQAYTHSMNKLEDAKDKSFDIQAKLEEAQRNEELAAAKYGLDSVQADKKARATAKLEREKMAHDLEVHKLTNAAHIQAAEIQAGATRYSADARNTAYGDRVKAKGNITQYQYGQLVDKASDNVDKMIKDQMLGFTMSPEELSAHRQRMIEAEIQRMVGGMGGGMMPTQPVAANTGKLPGYTLLSSQ